MTVKPMDPTTFVVDETGDCAHVSATRSGPDSGCITGNSEVVPAKSENRTSPVSVLYFHLSRPMRRAIRNTSAATTATIPRAKRMVFIVLLLSGDSMSEYYTVGEFRRDKSW